MVLIALGVSVYLSMARHVDSLLRTSIEVQAEHVTSVILFEHFSLYGQHPLSVPPLEGFEDQDTIVQVLDLSGNPMARSSLHAAHTVSMPLRALESAFQGTPSFFGARIEGRSYQVGLFPVPPPPEVPQALLMVATDEEERSRTLSILLYVLIASGVTGIALAGLLGWATASTALKPIREAIEMARAIALSKSFGQKLPPRDSHDELGQMIAAFNAMLSSLEAAQATQQKFIADASHELRAPLTTIRGNLDLLERASDMPPQEQAEALQAARAEAERMSRLLADLLTLARADAQLSLKRAGVELDAVVVEVYQQLVAGPPPVRLNLSHLEPALVRGDRDRLRQLVLILTDNATRYTPRGGSVTISLGREEPWAVLTVADTGIGIDPSDLPHVFERFYRSEKARAIDPDGTGLGLAIALWVVDSHGGKLDLQSTPGQGTTATVRLPLSP